MTTESNEPAAMRGPHEQLTKAAMGIRDGLPLNVTDGGIEELRRDIQMLMDIEAVKQLKYAYFRCLDTGNLTEMAELFCDDIKVHFVGGTYEWKLDGRDEYIESIAKAFTKQAVGHHNGHHPEVQILSENEATAIWYLTDNMWILNHRFFTTGTAMYWDRYRKRDGRWKIRETRYRRIYEITRQLDENPPLSAHHLSLHGS